MTGSVVIVGGGIAGLVAARDHATAGRSVTVLEAGHHTGGAVAGTDLGGVVVDIGAEAFGVSRPETRRLVEDLGLGDLVVAPRRSDARLLHAEGTFAMPPALLGIPTDLDDDAFVALVGEDAARRARLLDAGPLVPVDPRASIGDLVGARLGPAVVERLLAPVVAGVHASDPDVVEAEAVLPGLGSACGAEGSLHAAAARMRAAAGVPGAAIVGLTGGMGRLVAALERDAVARGVEVRCDSRATALSRRGPAWVVTTPGGEVIADHLVLAVDAPAAYALLAHVPGAEQVAAALGGITVGDVALVALVVRSEQLDADPVGSGVLVAPAHPRVHAKAMTHATAKWDWLRTAYGPGRHLVRLSYGRNGRIDEDVDGLASLAAADLGTITGADDVVVEQARVVRWDRSLVRPAPGHRDRVRGVADAVEAVAGLSVIGAGLGGNGLAGTIATAQRSAAEMPDHPRERRLRT